jgi:tetratricopeptide (TPR) repeat protein
MSDDTIADKPDAETLRDEPTTDESEAETLLDDIDADESETKTFNLGWRIALAVLALVIGALLAYPYIREQFAGDTTDPTSSQAEPQAALPEAETEVQPELDSAASYFELGNSYYEAGQWDQAVIAYKRAIDLDPNYQPAYANLGVTYYQQQQFDLATSQYKKALELDPDDSEVAYNLGALYVQQALSSQTGQPNLDLLNQAIEQLKNVVEVNPELAEPHFTLGVAYLALNQEAEAAESFETFLRLDKSASDSQARQEAEKYLQSLQGQTGN